MTAAYDSKDMEELATAVAAAAYAICSMEETRAEYEQRMVESFRAPPAPPPSRSSSWRQVGVLEGLESGRIVTRSLSFKEVPRNNGDRSTGSQDRPVRTTRQGEKGERMMENKADAWQKARIAKITKWYEKMSAKIAAWEKEKKRRNKLLFETRMAEIERLKKQNMQHYENKMEWIDRIVEGAKKELEMKRKKDEHFAQLKANKIRSTGKLPVQCLCFECYP